MSVYAKGDRGLEITRLQIALKDIGVYTGSLDDVFGGGMDKAVRAYQQRKGLLVTGEIDDGTGARILSEPSPRATAVVGKPAAYRSLALTAGFETSAGAPDCFTGLAGDFDQQGISFGVLQWNFGQGTLQGLLKDLDTRHPQVLNSTFGDGCDTFRDILRKDKATQLAWARTIQSPDRRSLAEPWRSRFKALGRTAECNEAQVRGAEERFRQALRMCEDYGLFSQRGAALMFDIVVQNGSISPATRQTILNDFRSVPAGSSPEERELAKMRIIGNRRAEAARPEFVEDVRRRKLTIANGVGIVHGVGYDLQRQYLLDMAPISPGSVTVPMPG